MFDISIVTISFNQVQYLKDCIDSVLSQSGVNVQYIVVDPGSTDGSRELIASYGNRIISVFEKDDGPADGLRRGFDRATAPICGFLNSDDIFYPGALAAVVEEFRRNPSIALVGGYGYIIDENGNKTKHVKTSIIRPKPYVYGAVTLFQQGTFFSREMYICVGGFNLKNRTCWDGELFLDIVLAGGHMRVVNKNWAGFRIHGGSISGSGRLNEQYKKDHMRLFEKVMGRSNSGFLDSFVSFLYKIRKIFVG